MPLGEWKGHRWEVVHLPSWKTETPTEALCPEYIENSCKPIFKNTNFLMSKTLEQAFHRPKTYANGHDADEIWSPVNHQRRKTRHQLPPTRKAKRQRTDRVKRWWVWGAAQPSYTCSGVKGSAPTSENLRQFLLIPTAKLRSVRVCDG